VLGNVHITRGENQLNGAAAIVNMKTGLATLTQVPGERVKGLVVPNAPATSPPPGNAKPGAPAPKKQAAGSQAVREAQAAAPDRRTEP
jgi:lipopolysaccharide export system protein LptA